MCIKKVIGLSYKKEVSPLQVLRNPERIIVLLPFNPYNPSLFIPAIKLVKAKFKNAEITGVAPLWAASFFKNSGLFNRIIHYESKPRLMTRQFFRLRKKLRAIKPQVSIDFNSGSDLLSWLGGAVIRVGSISSPFINCRVKLSGCPSEPEQAIKIVEAICTGH
ncbi:MAG: hypothetical protein QMD71_07600 [bacterium]|nr:hypothetical protein [bacterium]